MSRLGVSVDLKAGIGDKGFATGDTYTNIHNIKGSTAADTLVGEDSGDSIDGNGGHDSIRGGTGNDSFTGDSNANYLGGGVGDDTLIGGGGADTLSGGTGNDSLRLDWSSLNLSNLDGGAGTDTVVLTGTGSVSLNFTASAFTGVLTNTEYLDFSAATSSNNLSVNLDGAGIQKILTGSTSNTNAGVLDLKLDTGHFDTLTLAANGTYSYWTAASAGTQISNGASITTINLSTLNATGQDIYVFDSTHTTLLADLHYHV
jgi:Ca2+-binding RTX toxin-like protein